MMMRIKNKALFILGIIGFFVTVLSIVFFINAENISTFREYIDASSLYSIVLLVVGLFASISVLISNFSIKSSDDVVGGVGANREGDVSSKVRFWFGLLTTIALVGMMIGVAINNIIGR